MREPIIIYRDDASVSSAPSLLVLGTARASRGAAGAIPAASGDEPRSVPELPGVPARLDTPRAAELLAMARRIPAGELAQAPERIEPRLDEAERILREAQRDAGALLDAAAAPDAGALTVEDYRDLGHGVALVRFAWSRWAEARRSSAMPGGEHDVTAQMVRQHREELLCWLEPQLAADAAASQRLSSIRAAEGGPALAEAGAALARLCEERADALAAAPPAARQAAAALRTLAPMLPSLLPAPPRGPSMEALRRDLDASFTWMLRAERRICAAAERCFAGTERLLLYATPAGTTRAA